MGRLKKALHAAEAARLIAIREALDAERRMLDAARAKTERAEFERLAVIKAEADAIAKVERDRVTALATAAEAAALLPDLEKVRAWVAAVRVLIARSNLSEIRNEQMAELLGYAQDDIEAVLMEINIKGLHEGDA